MRTRRQIMKEQEAKRQKNLAERDKKAALNAIDAGIAKMNNSMQEYIVMAAKATIGNQPEAAQRAKAFVNQCQSKISKAEGMKINVEMALLSVDFNSVFMDMYESLGAIANLPMFKANEKKMLKIRKAMDDMMTNIQINDAIMEETFSSQADFVAEPINQEVSAEIDSLVAAKVAEMGGNLAGSTISGDLKSQIEQEKQQSIY